MMILGWIFRISLLFNFLGSASWALHGLISSVFRGPPTSPRMSPSVSSHGFAHLYRNTNLGLCISVKMWIYKSAGLKVTAK